MATIAYWKRHVKSSLLTDPLLASVLPPNLVEQYCKDVDHEWRESFWSPFITLTTFLLQILSAEKTLRAAVAALLAQLIAKEESDLPSQDPSAYCQARRRLPLEAIKAIVGHVAELAQAQIGEQFRWLGHHVHVVDGSTVSMPDTPELQAEFPQPTSQKPGCGFPIASFVALFSWATGALVDLQISSRLISELNLFRRMWEQFKAGDVVLADRLYGSYVDLAGLLQRGVFCVTRLHQCRKADFRTGQRLGKNDRLATWSKPQWIASFGITKDQFDRLPDTLTVRLIRIVRRRPGFRSRFIVVATTLRDPVAHPADDIRALYRDRWTVELNLRDLKAALGMGVLRGMSPDVVRKEMWMHMLVYNLIRFLMWQAAQQHGRNLHRLSYTGTLHRIRVTMPLLMALRNSTQQNRLIRHLIAAIADDQVPHRPDRVEPRRLKRRPKPYDLLNRPRHTFRGRIDDYGR